MANHMSLNYTSKFTESIHKKYKIFTNFFANFILLSFYKTGTFEEKYVSDETK